MGNREQRIKQDSIHLYLAFQRQPYDDSKPKCVRQIIKNEELDLKILEAKLKAIGGYYRIHKTVNVRDPEKARKWLMKKLIDHPEMASVVDSEWRTALLQPECRATNYFMFDVDIEDENKIKKFEELIPGTINKFDGYVYSSYLIKKIKSPKGWHYITLPFDTREVCKLDYITLLRDGYIYVCSVGEK